ncbi:hypothetical protein GTA08_BOTSDO08395 [Neofusicoccum parvum]|uniref:Uncharacterized protein n=1 Tax=Neofusicoccum parvum TaxID=310453 RepID=A0ACB5RZR4_9PEZI|nr:hypothetical protein GTA08_BOTSDO08395 [Neofusicoccum parvum]
MPLTTFPSAAEHFKGFRIFDVPYKKVGSHPIQTSVLVPKEACKGPRPVIVRFHGGGLVSGTRLHAPWFPPYLLAFAASHGAAVVSPDYRLLPEARGVDILADIASLWAWLFASLHACLLRWDPLGSPAGADLARVMVSGESAGGWLALQSAFVHPARIRATLAIFPMLDLGDDHFTRGGRPGSARAPTNGGAAGSGAGAGAGAGDRDRDGDGDGAGKAAMMGMGTLLDAAIVDEYVAAAAREPWRAVSSVTPPGRMEFSIALFQHGRVGELLGPERRLYPVEELERLGRAGVRLPPLLVVHGTDDTVVPVRGSERFVEAWRWWQPHSAVRLVLRPGEHGFEARASAAEQGWLRDALDWVAGVWLSGAE